MAKVNYEKSLPLQVCYALMASLFALSTCFQFNDPDWYFWIPLYATACVVNLISGCRLKVTNSSTRKMAKISFFLGMFLFIKVSVEGFLIGDVGFWSVDMRGRTVREKLGSGLVISSMFMYLLESSSSNPMDPLSQVTRFGMPVLVVTAYGLSFIFFAFQHDDMRY